MCSDGEQYEFDRWGQMRYNPDFHFTHGVPFTQSDLEYLCKFHEVDGLETVGYAIGKTGRACYKKLLELKTNGTYDHYKSLNIFWAGRDQGERRMHNISKPAGQSEIVLHAKVPAENREEIERLQRRCKNDAFEVIAHLHVLDTDEALRTAAQLYQATKELRDAQEQLKGVKQDGASLQAM